MTLRRNIVVVLVTLACVIASAVTVSAQADFPGTQGKAGLNVFSGLGEPLSLSVVALREGVLQGAVAMRIELNGELVRLHVRPEMDRYDRVTLPECVDTALVVILTGRDFESEFFEVDTVHLELSPSPLMLNVVEATATLIPREPTMLIKNLRVQRSRGAAVSGAQTHLDVSFDNVELYDASGERLVLTQTKEQEETTRDGRYLEYTLWVSVKRADKRPPFGAIKGTFDVVMKGSRIVCGRRSIMRTARQTLTIR